MAFKQKTRLFNVRLENCVLSGIEATDVKDALDQVSDSLENFKDKTLTSVDSEPIYRASLGLETDTEEDASGTGLFDITISGTNEALVDRLCDALAVAIGGMGPEFGGLSDGCPNGLKLKKFISDTGLNVNAM